MRIKPYFLRILESIRKRGLINTIQFLGHELLFEWKYKVDTIGRQTLDGVTVKGSNKVHGYDYQGYSYFYFRKFISELPIKFEESVFIDFGSGKGRVLIMASEYGFKRIIGVEFGEELYETSLHNLKKVDFDTDNIEVICADTSDFTIPDEANVMCFYNPFDEVVMDKVLENIDASLEQAKRQVYLIYLSPLFENCFVKRGYESVYQLSNKNKLEGVIYKK